MSIPIIGHQDKTDGHCWHPTRLLGELCCTCPASQLRTPPERVKFSSLWCVQGVRETARSILAQDGVRGLYRGFGTVMLGAVPARVVCSLPCSLTWRPVRAHADFASLHMAFQASIAVQP